MRNAVQRRNHRERAQPLERAKWGLLEKHKDYSLRAKDHNTKKRKLKHLTDKARDRNEDEFYFAMVNSSSEGGRKRAKQGEENGGGKSLDHDVVRLMKTQDAGYLRTALQHARLERKALEEEVVLQTRMNKEEAAGRRIVFGKRAAIAVVPLVVDDDGNGDEEADGGNSEEGVKIETEAEKKKTHKLEVNQRKLDALRTREEQLSVALRALEDQRARMSGSLGGVTKTGVTFKPKQRKR